ncbi:hypothetical protein ABFS82_02G132100 [Erythranthe guttata]|uniref:Uncharacterized protein n=1 Tax=Erythranthe guttata TaxID=4155 RepID=A0A022QGU6_ERYGU|nr:PREDICTED: uncharacterized protein LOC105969814 isoform X1 [Erythranthe guttata]XP_012850046.1 PREDICTED: uncharacterized protein LOC105969814 isoform X2 [Erythranthe guttata]EYU26809.1 hypothetical protein MIMGU_mgv1a016383mg [Erythranthe guttata]|eukprot:XP_012850045.1 PREDICTED: uncharacterized protein LOC105969814 isoform X1 [Erythranthe guttata]
MVFFANCGEKFLVVILVVFLLCSTEIQAKSRVPITDTEIREKKNECYSDIQSGMWGEQCQSSKVATENCALRCLSPICYELIYESDPLEEGEKDFTRSSEYKYCMHKVSLGENLDGIRGTFDM